MMTPFRSYAATAAALALAALAPRAGTLAIAQDTASATLPVLRETLVSGSPGSAPGQDLQLVRFVIQPGTALPPHTHPGLQVGVIEAGILHYVVVGGGTSSVHRKGTAGRAGAIETLGPGESADLHPGDTLVEPEHLIHYGANLGDEPVVIVVAALLHKGQPTATIVDTPSQ